MIINTYFNHRRKSKAEKNSGPNKDVGMQKKEEKSFRRGSDIMNVFPWSCFLLLCCWAMMEADVRPQHLLQWTVSALL